MVLILGTPHGGVSSKQESGQMSFTQRDGSGVAENSTLMCVHCQFHVQIRIGSGTERGFCFNCNGVVCGKQRCMEYCLPWEAMIEAMEGSRNLENALEHNRRL
jgi:hypothetical protein